MIKFVMQKIMVKDDNILKLMRLYIFIVCYTINKNLNFIDTYQLLSMNDDFNYYTL